MLLSAIALLAVLTPAQSTDSCDRKLSDIVVQTTAGHKLAGTLALPAVKRAPLVIMIGGSGKSARDYDTNCCNSSSSTLENAFVCRGTAVFRFDEVGTGASQGSYPDYATTMTLANDVQDIVSHFAASAQIDPANIYMLGHSEGGVIAAVVASRSNSVKGVVLLSAPFFAGRKIVELQSVFRVARGELTRDSAFREDAGRAASERWYRYFLDFEPATYYRRVKQPVLILHGGDDWKVDSSQASMIRKALQSNGSSAASSCVIFGGIGHDLSTESGSGWQLDPRVLRELSSWYAAIGGRTTARSTPGSCARRTD